MVEEVLYINLLNLCIVLIDMPSFNFIGARLQDPFLLAPGSLLY